MESLSPQQSLIFWQNGKPLEDAMWELCDSDIRNSVPQSVQNAYREMRVTGDNESYLEAIANECVSSVEMRIYSQQVESQINDMLENVYHKISSGELIAFGFKFPIESDFPTLVPLHLWPPEKVDMDKSEISANGVEFVRVHIIKKSKTKTIKNNANINGEIVHPEIKVEDKKVGRPSLKEEIIEAYEVLKKEGKIEYLKTLKAHTKLIQSKVQELNDDINGTDGMQHEAIRRTLCPSALKRTRKTSKPTSKL